MLHFAKNLSMLKDSSFSPVGNRLQTARKNIRYTQEAFAETLGISVEHYRKLESGVYALQLEKMLLLYKTYKMEVFKSCLAILGHCFNSFQSIYANEF